MPNNFPTDLNVALSYYARSIYNLGRDFMISSPSVGNFVLMTSAEYTAAVWTDPYPQPAYADLLSVMDAAWQWFVPRAAAMAYPNFKSGLAVPPGQLVVGTAVKTGAFPVIKSAVVASGNLVLQLTDDNTSTGIALAPNGEVELDSLVCTTTDTGIILQPGLPVLSNGNKTLTIPMLKSVAVTVLGISVLGAQVAANGETVKATVWVR